MLALGVNGCPPDSVAGLIGNLRLHAADKLIVVYPDCGAQYDAERTAGTGSRQPRSGRGRPRSGIALVPGLSGAAVVPGASTFVN